MTGIEEGAALAAVGSAAAASAAPAATAGGLAAAAALPAYAGAATAASTAFALPTFAVYAGLAASAIGTIIQVASGVQQGNAIGTASRYNQVVAEQNAQQVQDQAKYDAQLIDNSTQQRVRNIRLSGEATNAEGRALVGVSGVATDSGSPLLGYASNVKQIELAALGEEYSGQVSKDQTLYRGDLAARNIRTQNAIDTFSAAQAQRSAYFGAGSTLLTGAGNTAIAAYKFSNAQPKRSPTAGSSLFSTAQQVP